MDESSKNVVIASKWIYNVASSRDKPPIAS
jgi:hypothetical protein